MQKSEFPKVRHYVGFWQIGSQIISLFVSKLWVAWPFIKELLNQARASLRLAHTWFLKIDLVWIVGMRVCACVCPRPRLLINSGVMWQDMKPI